MQIVSSKLTFFYKYIFILMWVIGFAFGARETIFFSHEFDARWLQYVVTWGAITLFMYFSTGSIKNVSMNTRKKQLEVSNFYRTTTIAFSEIADIDGSTYLSPRLVWFTLKNSSTFGKKISFIPINRPSKGIGKHPLVQELRKIFALDYKDQSSD